jgi:hypothetical protein
MSAKKPKDPDASLCLMVGDLDLDDPLAEHDHGPQSTDGDLIIPGAPGFIERDEDDGHRVWTQPALPDPLPGLRPWGDVSFEGWDALLAGRELLVLAAPFGTEWISSARFPPGKYPGPPPEQDPSEFSWMSLWKSHKLVEWVNRPTSRTLVLLPDRNYLLAGGDNYLPAGRDEPDEPDGTWREAMRFLMAIGRNELWIRTETRFSPSEPLVAAGPLKTVWDAGLSTVAAGMLVYRLDGHTKTKRPRRGVALRPASAPPNYGFVGVGGSPKGHRILVATAKPIQKTEQVDAARRAVHALGNLTGPKWREALTRSLETPSRTSLSESNRAPSPPSEWVIKPVKDGKKVVAFTVDVAEFGRVELNLDQGKALAALQKCLHTATFISRIRTALHVELRISRRWLKDRLRKKTNGPYVLSDSLE